VFIAEMNAAHWTYRSTAHNPTRTARTRYRFILLAAAIPTQ